MNVVLIDGERSMDVAPDFVISALLYRDPSRSEVLVGVRRATPLVRRFPGVVSIPTMGLPADLLPVLAPDLDLANLEIGVFPVRGQPPVEIGRGGYLSNATAYVLENLLARKLGLADALIEARFAGTAHLHAHSFDEVADPLGTNQSRWTIMLNYSIVITAGQDQIAARTNSYVPLIWTSPERLRSAIDAGDALLIDDTLNPFEVCIHGLCLRSIPPITP
ncbi:hypothetical protein ACFPJ1_16420 [Kribbella qitaiheensis]|uniref:hypothetical protein n=1 Tax=Kribbella qitaiheensis TaxID=1544730 RepID=UPI00360AC7C4